MTSFKSCRIATLSEPLSACRKMEGIGLDGPLEGRGGKIELANAEISCRAGFTNKDKDDKSRFTGCFIKIIGIFKIIKFESVAKKN